jgi:hypothetical protein
MKLKISILLTVVFSVSLTAFGQKETVKPNAATKRTTGTKTADTKTAAAKMPTVSEILAKFVEAIGGKQANEKIKSRMAKGTVELIPMGIKGTFENYSAAPNKSVAKVSLAGIGDLVEGFDGTTAWSVNPIQGNRDKQGEELAQAKLNNDFNRETNFAKLYPKLELKGIEKVGESDAYVVVGTPDNNLPSDTFYFDTKSGLLVRQDTTTISPEGKMPGKTFLEDYRAVDGVKIPFKTRTVLPQFELVTTFTEVKNNVAVEDSRFAKPKA